MPKYLSYYLYLYVNNLYYLYIGVNIIIGYLEKYLELSKRKPLFPSGVFLNYFFSFKPYLRLNLATRPSD